MTLPKLGTFQPSYAPPKQPNVRAMCQIKIVRYYQMECNCFGGMIQLMMHYDKPTLTY